MWDCKKYLVVPVVRISVQPDNASELQNRMDSYSDNLARSIIIEVLDEIREKPKSKRSSKSDSQKGLVQYNNNIIFLLVAARSVYSLQFRS